LSVTVSSAFGEPVAGGLVSFTGPGSGASATFSGNPAVIAADGSASVSATANGAAGTYTVTASTGLSSAGFTLTNFAQPAFVSLDAPTITYGTATATLGGTIFAGASVPTGSVNITVNGVTEPAAIDSNGNFSVAFPTATLHATNSPYAITYAYAGNGPFFPVSDSSQVLSVNKATPTLVVTGATATYDGSAHPATFTITGVNGDNLTSLVTLTYAGSANVPVNAGTYAVLASFAGNADYLAVSNSSQSVVIAQAAATISVSPYTVTYDAASHTATGTATGVGGVNLGSDLNLTGTTHPNAGTYSTDAWTFTDATGNYQSASGTVNDVINQATTTTVMTSSVNPSSPGQSVTFTAIVSPVAPGGGTPTGSVTFENGSTVLGTVALSIVEGQAEATLATTFSTLGTFTITATYENTGGNYTASSISLAQTVQVGQTPGVYVFGTTLYVIGANTSDYAAISPAGAKNDGRTGLSVSATLNGVWSLQTFTQTFTAIVIVGFGGNDNFQLAGSLNLPTSVTEGNGNNYVLLGGGNDTISLGDGADYVSAGDGNDNVTVGNGNDNIQLGNGSDVVVEGNGNDYVSAGNGADLVVGGLGQHTIQLGNGNDILIDGSATVINTGDSLWQILSDWNSNSSTSVNTRLKVVYNTTHPNVLKAGSGRDWFFYNAPTTSNKKSTDRLN
jgi:hypothetical protein